MPPEGLKVKSRYRGFARVSPEERLAMLLLGAHPLPPEGPAPAAGALGAVIFGLGGVLVDTAELHYQSWRRLADELGLPFTRHAYDSFRGVDRMECLQKLLGRHGRGFVREEKILLAEKKNQHFLELIAKLRPTDLASGARALAMSLRAAHVPMGLVSASRNAARVLELLEITEWFDVIVDGEALVKSPAERFTLAADRLGLEPNRCVALEDGEAGVLAAHQAGMQTVGVGNHHAAVREVANVAVSGLHEVTLERLQRMVRGATLPSHSPPESGEIAPQV